MSRELLNEQLHNLEDLTSAAHSLESQVLYEEVDVLLEAFVLQGIVHEESHEDTLANTSDLGVRIRNHHFLDGLD